MPKIKVFLKSYKIETFPERTKDGTHDTLNTVRFVHEMCIVKHSLGKTETVFPLANVRKVEVT